MLLPFIALLLLAVNLNAQDRILTVTGKVTDELDKPLTGVTIRILQTAIATATNKDGMYTINVNPVFLHRLSLRTPCGKKPRRPQCEIIAHCRQYG
jgi:hypothetical protein